MTPAGRMDWPLFWCSRMNLHSGRVRSLNAWSQHSGRERGKSQGHDSLRLGHGRRGRNTGSRLPFQADLGTRNRIMRTPTMTRSQRRTWAKANPSACRYFPDASRKAMIARSARKRRIDPSQVAVLRRPCDLNMGGSDVMQSRHSWRAEDMGNGLRGMLQGPDRVCHPGVSTLGTSSAAIGDRCFWILARKPAVWKLSLAFPSGAEPRGARGLARWGGPLVPVDMKDEVAI